MEKITRYRYEQRIEEFRKRTFRAESQNHFYRGVLEDIYEHLLASPIGTVNAQWVLQQFRRIWMKQRG